MRFINWLLTYLLTYFDFVLLQIYWSTSVQSSVWQSYRRIKMVHFLTHCVLTYCVCTEVFHCTPNPCVNGVCREDDTLGYSCECCPAFTGRNCETAVNNFKIPVVRQCDNIGTGDCYYTIGEVHCPVHHYLPYTRSHFSSNRQHLSYIRVVWQ